MHRWVVWVIIVRLPVRRAGVALLFLPASHVCLFVWHTLVSGLSFLNQTTYNLTFWHNHRSYQDLAWDCLSTSFTYIWLGYNLFSIIGIGSRPLILEPGQVGFSIFCTVIHPITTLFLGFLVNLFDIYCTSRYIHCYFKLICTFWSFINVCWNLNFTSLSIGLTICNEIKYFTVTYISLLWSHQQIWWNWIASQHFYKYSI